MDNFLERINNEANTQFTKAQASFEQFYRKENQVENDQNQQAEPIQTILYPGTLKTNQIYTIEGYQIQLLKFLAEGTYAHVYLAAVMEMPVELKLNNNKMVLKRVVISDNKELEKLKNEIKFMKSLSGNMNIVDYYASTIHPLQDGSGSYEAFILMEYCSDGTLFDLMKSREPVFFNEKEILFLFHDICMGVAAMHYHEPVIVHRDIKVENVLISYNKRFKLCDFGSGTTEIIPPNTSLPVAKATQLEIELDSCTTLQYRAPETIDLYMRRGLGEKMDIWALGILLYKLCYFITPFEEVGKLAILNCKFEFPAKPMIPNPILKLINDMLQEDPLQRPNIYQIVLQVSKLRNVPCNLKEKIDTYKQEVQVQLKEVIPPATQTHEVKKAAIYPPTNQFDFQTENIVPMRRGRPSRNKNKINPSESLKSSDLPSISTTTTTTTVNNTDTLFSPREVDPFEMLVNNADDGFSNTTLRK